MARVFRNIGRAVSKAAKDTGRAVSKAARDTVDETHRNLNRPWEAALIGAALTPFTGGLSATALVGGGAFASGAAARHTNVGQALKSAGRSTAAAGAGALVTSVFTNPGTLKKATTAGGWLWGKLKGVVNKSAAGLQSGWNPNGAGSAGKPGDSDGWGTSSDGGWGSGGGGGGFGDFGGGGSSASVDDAANASVPNNMLLYIGAAVLLVVVAILVSRKS